MNILIFYADDIFPFSREAVNNLIGFLLSLKKWIQILNKPFLKFWTAFKSWASLLLDGFFFSRSEVKLFVLKKKHTKWCW